MSVHLVVLGVAQDGGWPHSGCTRLCCSWSDCSHELKGAACSCTNDAPHSSAIAPSNTQDGLVSCVGVVDAEGGCYLLDATPDFPKQLRYLQQFTYNLTSAPSSSNSASTSSAATSACTASLPASALPESPAVSASDVPKRMRLDGVFITHAHIGHYTGLMYVLVIFANSRRSE